MSAPHPSDSAGQALVRVGLIGTGAFAVTLLAQSRRIPDFEVAVVGDRQVAIARRACLQAGWSADALAVCEDAAALAAAGRRGQTALVADPALLPAARIDVLVESTGDPEAGAVHALAAIQAGRHVIMVNKETDVVVGPLLRRRAAEAGVVYTPVDGDQHGLLIAMVQWARALGLSVVCAGKARNAEAVIADHGLRIEIDGRHVALDGHDAAIWGAITPGRGREICARRRAALDPFPRAAEPDLCEMAIAANAAGLAPDKPALHTPLARITEIPEVLATVSEGGLMKGTNRVEVVTCLRPPHTPGLAGGVFLVVACNDLPPWDLIRAKGFIVNGRGTTALLFRPYHLLGIETLRTIREAVRDNRSLVDADYRPRFDLVARATRDLAAGTRLEAAADGQPLLAAEIQPARPVRGDHPAPLYMALGRRLTTRLATGQILRTDMLAAPGNSPLWTLRRQQDDLFL